MVKPIVIYDNFSGRGVYKFEMLHKIPHTEERQITKTITQIQELAQKPSFRSDLCHITDIFLKSNAFQIICMGATC